MEGWADFPNQSQTSFSLGTSTNASWGIGHTYAQGKRSSDPQQPSVGSSVSTEKVPIHSSLCLQEGLTEVCILRHLYLHSFSLAGRAQRRLRFGESE